MANVNLAHSLESRPRTKDVISDENISFDSLFLPDRIIKGLTESGFLKPSPIQIKALPLGRCGFDLIIQSKSGTGKTLIFSIIALESIALNVLSPQVLIISPTREIAVQIHDVISKIGKHFDSVRVRTFIGGLSLETDIQNCKTCHIAVGTPGRLKQLIQNKHLPISKVRIFVLDEADKLLENNFLNDINEIYNTLPDKKQVVMCSATYPDELKEMLSSYMLSPTYINVEFETPLLLGLKHFIRILKLLPNIVQQTIAKNEELLCILSNVSFNQCLIFSNYQTRAESISLLLNKNGWPSIYISSAQSQADRLSSLSSLKEYKCRILVSTDLTARGVDAANVDLVINYDIPADALTYLHRMGRAGRFGSLGHCINLAFSGKETKLVQNILGIIGGQNMSIPILDDTLNIKSNNLQTLGGIVPKNIKEFTDKCKQEVIEMKKTITKREKKPDTKENTALVIVNDEEEKALKAVEEKLAHSDSSDILQQLASGTFDMTTTEEKPNVTVLNNLYNQLICFPESVKPDVEYSQDQNMDTISILEQLANESYSAIVNTPEDKKRKRCASSPTQEAHVKAEIFCKNKALFGVAKSLSNVDTDKDDAEYLAKYLSALKAKESEETQTLFENKSEKTHFDLEDVFVLAYNSIVNKDAPMWKDFIPEEEKWKLEKVELEPAEQEEDEYDEDYDFEMEKDIEVNYETEKAHTQSENMNDFSFMKWIPVESTHSDIHKDMPVAAPVSTTFQKGSQKIEIYSTPNATSSTSDLSFYYNQYNPYFQQISNNLWQNGLSFENVDSFDEWFLYDWQKQMFSIRNFVQQKIYVQEMSRYEEQYKKE